MSVRPAAVGVVVALLLRPRLRLVGVGGVCGGLASAACRVPVRVLRAPVVVGRVGLRGRGRVGFRFSARSPRRPARAFLRRGLFLSPPRPIRHDKKRRLSPHVFARLALIFQDETGENICNFPRFFVDNLKIIYDIIFKLMMIKNQFGAR